MKRLFVVLPVMLLLLVGCDTKKPQQEYQYAFIDENLTVDSNVTQLHQLQNRYRDYWEASSRGDLNTSYTLELPYLNFLKSLEWYRGFKVNDKRHYKATMLRVTSEKGDSDVALVRANYKSNVMDINLTEKWIYINGQWYHYYSQSLLPPPPKPIR